MSDMERIVTLHVEKLPEGVCLATSVDIQGLVAQGRTIQETLEIARDVAKKRLESGSPADDALTDRLPAARAREVKIRLTRGRSGHEHR